MTVRRDIRHPAALVAIKLACARAVEAAGGQVLVAAETGRSQGRISDFCNITTPDFMPLDVAATVDALALGATGASPIADALARHRAALAGATADTPPAPMADHAARISIESAQLVSAMVTRLSGKLSPSAQREVEREAAQAQAAIAAMLDDIAAGAE